MNGLFKKKLKGMMASSLSFGILSAQLFVPAAYAQTANSAPAQPVVGVSSESSQVAISDSTAINVTSADIVNLRIMETTDIHSNIWNYNYYQDTADESVGFAKVATLIKQQRAEQPNNLLFDNGDLIQGTPLADYQAKVNPLKDGETAAVYKALNQMNYDAATLGNHEFNYGLDYLDRALKGAQFPYVNANVFVDDHDNNPDNDVNKYAPYKIIKKTFRDEKGQDQTLKIGVIGFAPPDIMTWDKDNLAGNVIAKDIVDTAKKYVPKLQAEGADLIIALDHSGLETGPRKIGMENTVYYLSEVPGIDAILFGHTHKVFPTDYHVPDIDAKKGTVKGVPAVETEDAGKELGVIDLTLKQVNGRWTVADSQSKTIPVKDVAPDEQILNATKAEHEATKSYVNGSVGTTTAPINSFFSLVQDDPSVQIVTNAQKWYVQQKVKGTEYEGMPILSVGAPFKAGNGGRTDEYTNIPQGNIAIKNVSDLYKFPNTVKVVKLNGTQIKEWLEMSAGQFNQIDPSKADEQKLINLDFPTYNFDVIDGVTYQIDVTQPSKYAVNGDIVNANASRIKNLQYNGKAIDPTQDFLVVTNNYRAGGGGKFPNLDGSKTVLNLPDENRVALNNYILDQKTINPSADGNWSIAPINDKVNVVFGSSQKAKTFADQSMNIKYVDVDSAPGMAKYRLDLSGNVNIKLLGINDLHGHLDYTSTLKDGTKLGSVKYLAAYLKQKAAANPNTLLVHAGDAVGASNLESSLLQDEPTIQFLNKLGLSVGTIGNHELDQGTTEFQRLIHGGVNPKRPDDKFEGANFPYVCANIVDKTTRNPIVDPYVIKEIGGVKVGFIGVITMDTPNIVKQDGISTVDFIPQKEAVNKYVKELQGKGVHTIVVLDHSGRDEATALAKQVDPDVDLILGGHDHAGFTTDVPNDNDPNKKIKIIEAYSYGTAFSDVDLKVDPKTQDVVSVNATVQSVYQAKIQPDAEIAAMVQSFIDKVAPIRDQKLGTATTDITRTTTAAGESALGDMIADAMKESLNSDFAFMNSGGIRDDLKAGNVTYGTLFGIQPFGNVLVKLQMTGKDLRSFLETPFKTGKSLGQISGFKYTYDKSKPEGQRITSLTKEDGTLIKDDQTYTMTVNDFCWYGGDGFTMLKNWKKVDGGVVDIDAFVNYAKTHSPLSYTIKNRIQEGAGAPSAPNTPSNDRDRNSGGGSATTPATPATPTTPAPATKPGDSTAAPENGSDKATPVFKDLASVAWAQKAIETLVEKGIIHGVDASGEKFAPLKQVTRAEFVAMLVNALGLMDENATVSFRDVKEDQWYHKAIASAYANKLVSGVGTNQFAPNKPITRQEMAAMMANALKVTKGKEVADVNAKLAKFKDKNSVAPYAKEGIALLLQEGIAHGTTTTTFSPKNKATRAEAAVMINNMLNKN